MSGSVDGAAAVGVLCQPAGEGKALQGDPPRGGGLLRGLLALRHAEPAEQLGEPGDGAQLAEQGGGGDELAGLDGLPAGEVLLQPGEVEPGAARTEGLRGGLPQQVLEDLQLALVVGIGPGVGELHLAAAGRDDARQVDHPGDRPGLPGDGGPADGGGGDRLQPRDGEPGADAGALVDVAGRADQPGEAGDDLHQVLGNDRAVQLRVPPGDQRLLVQQPDLVGQLDRVVGAHLGAEAVLQRGDDPTAVGVVLGVGAGDQEQVQRQPDPVAADLDVALLQHVEQRDLDPFGEVGQLVDAEDAAVGARDQAVVHGLRVTQGAPLGHLDRVDVADQVADAGVGGGELLPEPVAAVQPADRGRVAVLGDLPVGPDADRGERVLVELAAHEDRRPLVQQADQGPDQPGLALAPLAEQHEVVAGDERPLDLGDDGVLEPDDARQGGFAGGQAGQQVGADLGLDRAVGSTAGAEFPEGRGCGLGCVVHGNVRHLAKGTT